jgi:hypothetical protein
MPYSVGNPVGRLIEVRVQPPLSMEEAMRFIQDVVRVTNAHAGKIVAVTDLRSATRSTDPDAIDFIAGIIRSENPKLERNALVVAPQAAMFTLQMERMVKSAGTLQRRIFRRRDEAEAWLGEVLGAAERVRMKSFLAEERD